MANQQKSVTLSPYYHFVVERIAQKSGRKDSRVIVQMVEEWVSTHQEVIKDASATMTDFERSPENRAVVDVEP